MRKIEVIRQVEVTAVQATATVTGLRLRNVRDGGRAISSAGAVVFIGAQPRTGWLPQSVAVDSKGFILTGADAARSGRWRCDREPCTVESTCPGVFARGDVRSKHDQARRVRRRRRGAGRDLRTRVARGALIDVQRSDLTTILPICWFDTR